MYLNAPQLKHLHLTPRFVSLAIIAALSCPIQPAFGQGAQGGEPLRAGDVVRLRIWREPDLSGEFIVDREQIVTLPRLGRRAVGNLPSDSLRGGIIRDLQRYLTNPSIAVDVLRRVSVGGGVMKPGVYLVDEVMTAADAITLAGGTQRTDVHEIALQRDGRDTGQRYPLGTRLSEIPVRSGDEILVPRPSWLQRNTQTISIVVSSALALVTILTLVGR